MPNTHHHQMTCVYNIRNGGSLYQQGLHSCHRHVHNMGMPTITSVRGVSGSVGHSLFRTRCRYLRYLASSWSGTQKEIGGIWYISTNVNNLETTMHATSVTNQAYNENSSLFSSKLIINNKYFSVATCDGVVWIFQLLYFVTDKCHD